MKSAKIKALLLVLVTVFACGILAACGGGEAAINYTGSKLADGEVGAVYSQSVATATGADGITYALDGTAPAGLTLSESGTLSGTPTAAGDFTLKVKASAKGAKETVASFTLTINEAAGSETVTRFETELTDLTGLTGGGVSGAPADPLDMIVKSSTASNGFFLGWLHRTGSAIKFTVNAETSGTGVLTLGLGSEIGAMAITRSIFSVAVNGTEYAYTSTLNVPESPSGGSRVFAHLRVGTINLSEGENEIVFTVQANTLLNGTTAGPLFDYMEIDSECGLSWSPVNSNLDGM